VHLLYYLMFDDAVGEAVARRCCAAARGVTCRLLLDAVGAKRGLRAIASACWRRRGRARDAARRPALAPQRAHGPAQPPQDRGVRQRVAYVGSQNLAEAPFVPGKPNRELVARVRGPVVAHLEAVFASDWYMETGQRLDVMPTVPCMRLTSPPSCCPAARPIRTATRATR
jgi:cardiolipin synthase